MCHEAGKILIEQKKDSLMDAIKILRLIPVLFALLLLASCSSSDGGNPGTTATTATTGRVSLLITDAPTDDFDQVNLTVESISFLGEDDGHETIVFDESRVIDLLSLQNYSDLLVTAVIPVGTYDKIRLHVSQVELVKFIDGGDPESIITKLPANGKVDLNPRGTFEVVGDGHLMIELDIDAEKSIHIVEKGNGETSYNFRPVVFVNIVGVDDEVKLVFLEDRQVFDRTESGFQLCEDTDEVPGDDDEFTHHDDEEGDDNDDHDSCIAVVISDNTVVQNDLIEVVDASNIVDGSIVNILGKLSKDSINALHIVIEDKDKEVSNLAVYSGTATTAFDFDNFTMDATTDDDDASIQPLTITELAIALVAGSGVRVFDKNGDEVSADSIIVGTNTDVFGLSMPDIATVSKVQAAFVIINNEVTADKLSGTIAAIDEAGSQLTVLADVGDITGDICVDTADAIIFILAIVDKKVVTKEILISNLQVEMLIDVYGEYDDLGCVAADVILVAEPFATIPVETLVTGN
jgi:hypothetical protein